MAVATSPPLLESLAYGRVLSARRGLRLPRWAAIAKRVPATVTEPHDAFFSLTFPGEMNPYVLVGKKKLLDPTWIASKLG